MLGIPSQIGVVKGKVQQKWGLYGRSYGRQLYGQDGGHLGELGWIRTV